MDLLNKVMIAGNLTQDPEIRETTNGKKVANVRLALDPPGGGKKDGNTNPAETIFVDVEFWERTAETAAEYLKKGSGVIVEGRLKMDCWEDRETGKTRRKLRVAGERMKFLNLGNSGRENRGTRDERDNLEERDERRDQGRGQGQGGSPRQESSGARR